MLGVVSFFCGDREDRAGIGTQCARARVVKRKKNLVAAACVAEAFFVGGNRHQLAN